MSTAFVDRFKIRLPHSRAYLYSHPATNDAALNDVKIERPIIYSKMQPETQPKKRPGKGKVLMYRLRSPAKKRQDEEIHQRYCYLARTPALDEQKESFIPTTFTTSPRFPSQEGFI